MTRKVPLVATGLVVIAIGVMIALGIWQLRRMYEKEALLARYAAARGLADEVAWPRTPYETQQRLYRHATLTCAHVTERGAIAGRNAQGEAGVAQTARCFLPGGGAAEVVLGWSRAPNAGQGWSGGTVRGVIAPGPRLVADPPLGGLAPMQRPDPAEIPNNHLAYAVQWFLFAATAAIIYLVALRRRAG